ncbi:MAG: polysaccharide biosynthesis/export family protein [Elusimicrobiales bacterium]|nr:polysaccharide biosynthesis/export family protein [Elusimicrobiales bacterium]
MKSLGIWGPLALVLSLSACAGLETGRHYPAKNHTNLTPAQEEAIEARILQTAQEYRAQSQVNYKVQAGDLLEIAVFQEKDMARTVRVSGNGTITFPLAGNIKLADLSVPEAEAMLAQALSEFIINPQVTVLIKEYSNKQVYVLGEVKKPGSITLPVERRLTVLEAITLAGGFTDLAAQDKTKVLRNKDGRSETIEVQISKITKQGDKSADIFLEPNDTVFVPQSFF